MDTIQLQFYLPGVVAQSCRCPSGASAKVGVFTFISAVVVEGLNGLELATPFPSQHPSPFFVVREPNARDPSVAPVCLHTCLSSLPSPFPFLTSSLCTPVLSLTHPLTHSLTHSPHSPLSSFSPSFASFFQHIGFGLPVLFFIVIIRSRHRTEVTSLLSFSFFSRSLERGSSSFPLSS